MVRALSVIVVCLSVLVFWEGRALVGLKADLGAERVAQQQAASALHAIEAGPDEMVGTVTWLQAYVASTDGLHRAGGLCADNTLDAAGLGGWLNVYVQARVHGASEADARQAVIAAIRTSPDWQRAHAAPAR